MFMSQDDIVLWFTFDFSSESGFYNYTASYNRIERQGNYNKGKNEMKYIRLCCKENHKS